MPVFPQARIAAQRGAVNAAMSDDEILAKAKADYEAANMSDDDILAKAKADYKTAQADESLFKGMKGKRRRDAESDFTTGEKLTDVGRTIGRANQESAEFMADTAGFLMPRIEDGRLTSGLSERVNRAFERSGEEEGGVWDNMKAWGGGFMEPTEFGERTANLFESPEMFDEQISEEQGGAGLNALKKGAELTTELATTAWMGGAKAAPIVAKTLPTSAILGTAGEAAFGDAGEMAGVITGALTGGPVETVKLLPKLLNFWSHGKALKKATGDLISGGKTLANASDQQINSGLNALVAHAYPDISPDDLKTYVETLVPKVKAAIADNKKGTVGQLTDDAGILAFEREMTDPVGRLTRREDTAAMARVNAELAEQADAPMAAIAGETAEAANIPAQLVRTEKEDIAEVTGKQLRRALTAETKAKKPFIDQPTTVETSERLHKTTQGVKDRKYRQIKENWKQMEGNDIPAESLDDALKMFYDDIGENAATMFKQSFGDVVGTIKSMKGNVGLDEVSDILSQFSSKINTISKGGASGVALKPERIEAFKNAMYEALEVGKTGASDTRKALAKEYRDFQNLYGPRSTVGKALAKDSTEFGADVVSGGVSGTKKQRALEKATGPSIQKRTDAQLRADFAEKYPNPTQGNINTFVKRYQNQMSDALRDDLDKMRTTGVKADLARKVESEAVKKVSDLDKSIAGKFAQTGGTEQEIVAAAKRAMTPAKGKDITKDMVELLDTVKGSPTAKDHIRRAFMDEFVNSVSKNGQLTQKSLKKFKQNRSIYEKSGLYTKAELDAIEDGMVEGQKMFLHENAPRLAKLPPEKKRVAEVLAALGGAKIGAMAMGSPLIGAAMGRKAASTALEEMTSKQAKALAFELTVNPQKFVAQVDRLKKGDLNVKEINRTITEMLKKLGTGTAETVIGTVPAGIAGRTELIGE